MAPRTTRRAAASSSASRTYHSSPAPQQQHFPSRRRNIKTYGRNPSSARALRQQTLTQFDLLHQNYADEPGEHEELPLPATEETRPSKRRKTLGDTPSSSFHTQTLTQMLSDKEDSSGIQDMLQVEYIESESADVGPIRTEPSRTSVGRELDTSAPHTPTTKMTRRAKDEILSSQPSPFTPVIHPEFFSPTLHRSPLTEKSTNVHTAMPTEEEMANKSPIPPFQAPQRRLRRSLGALSPSKKTQLSKRRPLSELPNKSPEFGREVPMAGENESEALVASQKREASEIPDSDAELESMDSSPQKQFVLGTTPRSRGAVAASDSEGELAATPSHGPARRFGNERPDVITARNLLNGAQRSEMAGNGSRLYKSKAYQDTWQLSEGLSSDLGDGGRSSAGAHIDDTISVPAPDDESQQGGALSAAEIDEANDKLLDPGTPTPKARHVHIVLPDTSPDDILSEPPTRKTPDKSSPGLPRITQGRSQYQSQGLESQRVPLEVIQTMSPQTDRSDVLVSIHPTQVDMIVKGAKNHDFRSVKIPDQVSRMWIYVTKPAMELRFLATIGPAKRPGEIEDETGDGNNAFNRGKMKAKFAHELLQVYQLNNPVSLRTLKANGWAENAPSGHTYLPPAAVGQLLGNLRCALFEEHGECTSVSQELEEQLLSDLVHSTQMANSDPVRGNADEDEVIPSTQLPVTAEESRASSSPPNSNKCLGKPPGPGRAERTPVANRKVSFVRPSQATTASQSSTPTVSPEKSVPRPTQLSSIPSLPEYDEDDTPIRQPSGDLLLESSSGGLLPDSLVADHVSNPPDVIWDSEDDDDEPY